MHNPFWKLYFDGAYSRKGNGVGVLLVSLKDEIIPLSYKLEFDTTNNITKYEVLVLGLRIAKNLKIECLTMFGDSQLVVKQIKGQCQTKHPRLRSYTNEFWDLIDNFFSSFNIQFLSREKNRLEDSLKMEAITFIPPQNPLLRYEF